MKKARIRRKPARKDNSGGGRPVFPFKDLAHRGPVEAIFAASAGIAGLENDIIRKAVGIARSLRELAAEYCPTAPVNASIEGQQEALRTNVAAQRRMLADHRTKRVISDLTEIVRAGKGEEAALALAKIYRAGADSGPLYVWLEHLPYAYSEAASESTPFAPSIDAVCNRLALRGPEADPGAETVRKMLNKWRWAVAAPFGRRKKLPRRIVARFVR